MRMTIGTEQRTPWVKLGKGIGDCPVTPEQAAELLGLVEREKAPETVETAVDELPVDAMVLDDDEAELLVGSGYVFRELRALGLERIECWDCVGHGRAIVPTAYGM